MQSNDPDMKYNCDQILKGLLRNMKLQASNIKKLCCYRPNDIW